MMKFIYLTASMLFCFNSFSTEVLLLGGGGEPFGESTIFDDGLKNLAAKKAPLDFKIKSSFNGGHSQTERILATEMQTPNSDFTGKNYIDLINEYMTKIKSGEIKSGEKLLILMNTHGGIKSPKYQTHSIATKGGVVENKTFVAGADTSSLDPLFDLAELAKRKGIKLGIVDLSCHSGNSLVLANQNTCVITASGPEHFSYTNFAEKFFAKLEKGKSLEEVFLATREGFYAPSFPMISTAIGNQLKEEQYNLLSPYLNVTDSTGTADKLTPYLRSVFVDSNYCKREDDFKKLITYIEEVQKITGIVRNQSGDSLIDALKSYKKLQDNYLKELVEKDFHLLSKKVDIVFGKNKKGAPVKESIAIRDILQGYPSGNLGYLKDYLRKEKDPQERREMQNSIAKLEKIQELRKDILSKNPTLPEAETYMQNLTRKHEEIWAKSAEVSTLASLLYDKKYRTLLKERKTSDPCRDFVL